MEYLDGTVSFISKVTCENVIQDLTVFMSQCLILGADFTCKSSSVYLLFSYVLLPFSLDPNG